MKAQVLIKEFKRYNIGPYIEVPCSILAPIISCLLKDKDCEVINPVNEAIAVGIAAGSYMSTRRIPALLIQNSGLCNTLNAFTSLNHIYRIPLLYIISWRGEPKTKDAPEHYVIGRKLKRLLKLLDIPYIVLSEENFKKEIRSIIEISEETKRPAALILRGALLEEDKKHLAPLKYFSSMTQSEAVDIILNGSHDKAYFVTTNGFVSREVFYNLDKKGIEQAMPVFYMLGSMGHALPIALGIARYIDDDKKIIVLDGDGGCLMHLGSMASVGEGNSRKLMHIVLDNGIYASTGGQPTVSREIDFCKIAQGCGYRNVYRFSERHKLRKAFPVILKKSGATFMHILVSNKGDKKRPRVSGRYTCEEIKDKFIKLMS